MSNKNRGAESKSPPRTNRERSQLTRKKIIKAAIYCLRHYGYEGTSIFTVAEQAGISKGAAQHQYPSKADLMYSVAEYGLRQQEDFRNREMAKINITNDLSWLSSAAEVSWKLAKKPYYTALLEIMMATRNDSELKKRFAPINKKIDGLYQEAATIAAKQLGIESNDDIVGLLHMHNTMIRGLAVGFMYCRNTDSLKTGFETLKRCERLLIEQTIKNTSSNNGDPSSTHGSSMAAA